MDHGVLFINKLKSKINNNKQIQNKMHHVESYVRFSWNVINNRIAICHFVLEISV